MKGPRLRLTGALLLFLFLTTACASGPPSMTLAVTPPYRSVTQARLENPEPENWLSYRGNYAGWGFSELDQITSGNVSDLEAAWTFSTGVRGGHESPPIVNDGVMYITT
ncbi:MAG: hypothetical protein ACKVIN_14795, partial [Longimicrobiales bacterium]